MTNDAHHPIRVSVIDDHELSAAALLQFIIRSGRTSEGQTTPTVDSLLECENAASNRSAVVLLDLELRDGSTVTDNIARLLHAGYSVVVYTQEVRPGLLHIALRAGAHAIVSKGDTEDELIRAIVAADARDHAYLSAMMSRIIQDATDLVPVLTPRQAEILRWHASGATDRELATRFQCSEATIRTHLRNIKERYDAMQRAAGTRSDLLKQGLKDGYVPVDWFLDSDDTRR